MKILTRLAIALVPVIAVLFTAMPADAQQRCTLHDGAVSHLAKKYNEKVVGRGLANSGKTMFELLVSKTGSWTVIATNTRGTSCVIATGESWHDVPILVGETS